MTVISAYVLHHWSTGEI